MDEEELIQLPSLKKPDVTPWARIIYCLVVYPGCYGRDHLVHILARLPVFDLEDAEQTAQVIMAQGKAVVHANTYKYCVRLARVLMSSDIPVEIRPVGYDNPILLSVLRPQRNQRDAVGPGILLTPTQRHIAPAAPPVPPESGPPSKAGRVLSLVVLKNQHNMTPAGVLVALMGYGMSYAQALQCAGIVTLVGRCVIRRHVGAPVPADHAAEFQRLYGYTIEVTCIHLPYMDWLQQ